METITFKGNLLTTKRIVIYVLLFATVLALLTYVYFTYWSAPLFQLIGAWQDATLIPQLALAAICVLVSTHFLFSQMFKKEVQLQLLEKKLLIKNGRKNLSVQLSDLKRINFVYRNEQLCRITIHTSTKYYLNVGDIFKGLPQADFKPWVGILKKLLQKEFSFKEDVNKVAVSKANTAIQELYDPSYDLKAKRKNYKKWLFGGLVIFLSVVVAGIYILVRLKAGGINIHGEDYGNSEFSMDQKKVYYLDVGNGYFELAGADAATFSPFTFGNEYGIEMGRDNRFVYYGNHKIAGINRKKAVYLGRNYIRDDKKVFYTNIPVPHADVHTFRSVNSSYNTLAFTYATDTGNVYYRQYRLEKLVPAQLRFYDNVLSVAADSNHVYYKNRLLDGLNGSNAQVRKIDNHMVYATDGASKHFVNEVVFPDCVPDNIFGTVNVNRPTLRLLQEKNSGSAHLLFYDSHHMYYYDEGRQEFLHAKSFKKELHIQGLGERVFTDGAYIYFTERRKLGLRSRGGGYNAIGEQTTVYRLKGIAAGKFKKIKTGDGYEIFSDGKKQYISIHNYGNRINVMSALYYLKVQDVDLADNIKKQDIDVITDKDKIFWINSRNYSPKGND